jgi:hypothetical protein
MRRLSSLDRRLIPRSDPDFGLGVTVQPSVIDDCAQVRNKAGEYLVRVSLTEVDKRHALRSRVNAGNHSFDNDFLAGVASRFGWLDAVDRNCRGSD